MKDLYKKTKILFILIFNFCFAFMIYADDASLEMVDRVKKSVVTVNTKVSLAAYGPTGSWAGTGFIANKNLGLLVTNKHIVGPGSISNLFITFYNGEQTEAKLLYYGIYEDLAVLKVDPKDIPEDAIEIKISDEALRQNQPVLIIGNNEGQDFSFHSGYISNLYAIDGDMPQHSYIINLNVTGGSSGSPILNQKGEAIGINYGGSKTYSIALKGDYIRDALDALKRNHVPVKKAIGVIYKTYSLNDAVNHRNFPSDIMKEYIKKYPEYRNQVICIDRIIKGSPAEGIFKSGDIIIEANGKPIGAELYILSDIINKVKDELVLTIYRDGVKIKKSIKPYDANAYKIEKILQFGGASFFVVDDFASAASGIPLNSLAVGNILEGSSFSVVPYFDFYGYKKHYRFVPLNISGHQLSDLDSLINVIPKIVEQKYAKLELVNYQLYQAHYNGIFITSHDNLAVDIIFDITDAKSKLFKFDKEKNDWIVEEK